VRSGRGGTAAYGDLTEEMPNENGSIYGLTILCPIIDDPHIRISHNLQIRMYLSSLPRHTKSPFAKVSSTHLARLVVMDDVVYVGMPACEEHLKSSYLVFECNLDGDLDTYLKRMAREIPEHVEAVWKHCIGYPGVQDEAAFVAYMKKCQITTTFFFADVNDRTVQQTLRALQSQAALTAFIEANQGKPADELQAAFAEFLKLLGSAAPPEPGTIDMRPGPCYSLQKKAVTA
jgi:hypothetical protein